MSNSRPIVSFQGLFSSGSDALANANTGVITTNTANQVLAITDADQNPVTAATIAIKFVTACKVKFAGTLYHQFDAGEQISLDAIAFTSITVRDSGSQLRFFGMYA